MIKQTCLQSVLDLVDFWNASREAHWYSGLHRIRMLHRTCETAADRWDLPSSDESWALVSVWNLVVSSASNQGLIGAGSSRVCMFILFQDASDLRALGDVLMSPVRLLSLSTSVDCFLISSRVFGKSGCWRNFLSISISSQRALIRSTMVPEKLQGPAICSSLWKTPKSIAFLISKHFVCRPILCSMESLRMTSPGLEYAFPSLQNTLVLSSVDSSLFFITS